MEEGFTKNFGVFISVVDLSYLATLSLVLTLGVRYVGKLLLCLIAVTVDSISA
jgi:hypothetical protein